MCRLMLMLFASLLVSSLAGTDFSAGTTDSPSRFQIPDCAYSLVLAKSKFSQSEPILLRLAVTNSSEQPLPVSLGYDREGAFVFTIKGPNGSVIELPRKRTREGLSRLGNFMVKPQSSYTQQLILNEWYDFPDPGVYEINARLKSSRQPESECLNATFTIEIAPLDKQ